MIFMIMILLEKMTQYLNTRTEGFSARSKVFAETALAQQQALKYQNLTCFYSF